MAPSLTLKTLRGSCRLPSLSQDERPVRSLPLKSWIVCFGATGSALLPLPATRPRAAKQKKTRPAMWFLPGECIPVEENTGGYLTTKRLAVRELFRRNRPALWIDSVERFEKKEAR